MQKGFKKTRKGVLGVTEAGGTRGKPRVRHIYPICISSIKINKVKPEDLIPGIKLPFGLIAAQKNVLQAEVIKYKKKYKRSIFVVL